MLRDAAGRLAGHAAARAGRRSSCSARRSARASARTGCSTSQPPSPLADAARAARHGARASRRRSRSGTTRASSTGCRSRRSCCSRAKIEALDEPDQPALPVQHADVDLVADPLAARDGAHGDHQAVGAAAPAAARARSTSSRCARSSRRSTSTSTSRWSASGRSCACARRSTPTRSTCIVPSMILQPLVENSIKHGLSRKVGGGTHHASAAGASDGRADHRGRGRRARHVRRAAATRRCPSGIGLSNVNERLRVIYGAALPAAADERARPRHLGRASRFPRWRRRGAGHVHDATLCAPSSWTTSSSRGKSCATCSTGRRRGGRRRRPATASRRSTPSSALDARPRVPRRPDARADRLRGGAPADRTGEPPAAVVFVTAFDQHAIEAFEVNAVDYLLKPVDAARLEQARAAGPAAGGRPRRPPLNDQLERIVQLMAGRQEPPRAGGREGRASGSCWSRPRRSSLPRWPTSRLT